MSHASEVKSLVSTHVEKTLSSEQDVKAAIRRFIVNAVRVTRLDDDGDLFESGIANSLFAVQLMTFVERTFDIDVETDDLDIQNFRSVNATTAFVLRKNGHRRD